MKAVRASPWDSPAVKERRISRIEKLLIVPDAARPHESGAFIKKKPPVRREMCRAGGWLQAEHRRAEPLTGSAAQTRWWPTGHTVTGGHIRWWRGREY